jgi:hypothetical protein
MTLADVVKTLELQDPRGTICVRRPWSGESDCVVTPYADSLRELAILAPGLDYFLEVDIAHETLEVFQRTVPTQAEKVAVLIYYAENDAYPDWAGDR